MDLKFKVGDFVCTKKEGPPAVGEIVATYSVDFYNWTQQNDKKKFRTREPRYAIYFPGGIKVITVDEIMQELGWKRQEAIEYYETLDQYEYLEQPESNLELMDT